jgi:hypothetical protein
MTGGRPWTTVNDVTGTGAAADRRPVINTIKAIKPTNAKILLDMILFL